MSEPIDPLDDLIDNPNGGLMSPEQVEEMEAAEEWDSLPDDDEEGIDYEEGCADDEPEPYEPDAHLDMEFEDRISGTDDFTDE